MPRVPKALSGKPSRTVGAPPFRLKPSKQQRDLAKLDAVMRAVADRGASAAKPKGRR